MPRCAMRNRDRRHSHMPASTSCGTKICTCVSTRGAGINGRGSHGHNDALSIEVSAGGCAFIVDPGTYLYTGDLQRRHDFRSTSYHSTVKIDGVEQNTIRRDLPFVIGDEARPRVLLWEIGPQIDRIIAEHYGYQRLKN